MKAQHGFLLSRGLTGVGLDQVRAHLVQAFQATFVQDVKGLGGVHLLFHHDAGHGQHFLMGGQACAYQPPKQMQVHIGCARSLRQLGFNLIEQGPQAVQQGVTNVLGHGKVQAFFVAKVIGDGRNVLPGELGNFSGGGAGQTVFAKHLHAGADQGRSGQRASPQFAGCHGFCGWCGRYHARTLNQLIDLIKRLA